MNPPSTSSAAFFEERYRERGDPWDFANSRYELGRYDAIIAALSHRPYHRAFEPGCSVGVLTERLAGISRSVDAIDFSATAVGAAAERCAHLPGVTVRCASLPESLPLTGFDLVVLSEIGYYFSPEEWRQLCAKIIGGLAPGSTLLGAHWLGHSPDHQMHGDEVHQILGASPLLQLEHQERHSAFRLERWVRV